MISAVSDWSTLGFFSTRCPELHTLSRPPFGFLVFRLLVGHFGFYIAVSGSFPFFSGPFFTHSYLDCPLPLLFFTTFFSPPDPSCAFVPLYRSFPCSCWTQSFFLTVPLPLFEPFFSRPCSSWSTLFFLRPCPFSSPPCRSWETLSHRL